MLLFLIDSENSHVSPAGFIGEYFGVGFLPAEQDVVLVGGDIAARDRSEDLAKRWQAG